MTIRAVMKLGVFAVAAWLAQGTPALAQPAPAPTTPASPSPITGDIGIDYIPGPSSDVGLGKIVTNTSNAYGAHGNVQFNTLGPVQPNLGFDFRNWQSTVLGTPTAFTTTSVDGRAEIGMPSFLSHTFIGIGFLGQSSSYGSMTGVGFGLDILPHYDRWFSVYGSAWYYPWESGTFTTAFPTGIAAPGPTLTQRVIKYRFGVTFGIPAMLPVYLDLGVAGDTGKQGNNYSPNTSEGGFFVGLRAALK